MDPTTTATERSAQFPAWCRAAGLKVTRQRRAIYKMLAHSSGHPTADDVYDALQGDLPSLSLGTVYKILDLFHGHGLVRRVPTGGQAARYDARLESHHHLLCSHCGCIEDVLPPPIPSQYTALPAAAEFHAEDYELLFHGTCAACREVGASHPD